MIEMTNRQMPHSTDAEQAILGAMLLDERVCETVKLKLQADDFYHHRHRIIYEVMMTLMEQNKGVDVTT
ncbi:MAG TPA: replicative DNA helicase, partial [Firmicutes bacterium]|nr:replicative DNA helicase [Bacillota bacterium]